MSPPPRPSEHVAAGSPRGATGEGLAVRRGTEVAVNRFGRSSVSAQISALLRDGIVRACTENGGAVAYATVAGIGGQARIAVGNPLVARADEEGAAAEFLARARADERRAAFFGVEGHDGEAPKWSGFQSLLLGDEPLYRTAEWPQVLAGRAALRYQLARGRRRGVTVAPGIADATPLLEAASRRRRMPALDFVVRWSDPTDARTFVATLGEGGPVVGVAVVREVPALGRWFIEHLLRTADAPNGTTELLFDAVVEAARVDGAREVTLGLLPLSPELPLPRPLRAARVLGETFYDFRGLALFKAKFSPQERRPIYYMHDARVSPVVAVGDLLRAFAGGSLRRFARATAIHWLRRSGRVYSPSFFS